MLEEIQERINGFILKRAFRRGLVRPMDVTKVTGVSAATAGRYLSSAETLYHKLLQRKGGGLEPRPLAQAPEIAGEAALLEDLDSGQSDPLRTGLFESELPVVYVSWTQSLPSKSGVLTRLIQAIQHEHLLRIVYIGLRQGAEPQHRRILPLALERMNDQWRIIAQDIEKLDSSLRVFVLSRILDAEPDMGGKPKNLLLRGHYDAMTDIDVLLNPKLNAVQQQVLSRELCIKGGKVRVPSRSRHEFLRRFTDESASPDVVWPPLILKGKK